MADPLPPFRPRKTGSESPVPERNLVRKKIRIKKRRRVPAPEADAESPAPEPRRIRDAPVEMPSGRRPASLYLEVSSCVVAVLASLGLVAMQLGFGGQPRVAFALPGYILVAAAGVLGVLLVFSQPRPRVYPLGFISAIAFFGYFLWRAWTAADPFLARMQLLELLGGLVIYGLCAAGFRTAAARMAFLVPLFLMAIAQSALAAIQYFGDHSTLPLIWLSEQAKEWYGNRWLFRSTGFYLNPNHLAWFLTFVTVFASSISLWGRWRPWIKILLLYTAAVSAAAMILTMSRGGVIGFSVAILVLLLLSIAGLFRAALQRGVLILVGGLAVLLVGVAAGFFTLSKSLAAQDRLSLLTEGAYRVSLWPVALRQFEEFPLLGLGAGTFVIRARQFLDRSGAEPVFAHNDWLQALAEYGGIGFGLLIAIVLVHMGLGFVSSGRLLKGRIQKGMIQSNEIAIHFASLSVLAGYAAHSVFDFNLQLPANALLAAALLGFLSARPVKPSSDFAERASQLSGWGLLAIIVAAAIGLGSLVWLRWDASIGEVRAENALLRNQPQDAVEEATRVLEHSPDEPALLFTRGEALSELSWDAPDALGRFQLWREAAADYQAAIEASPTERIYHLKLARRLDWLTRYSDAVPHLIEGVRLEPGRGFSYEYIGLHYQSLGQIPEARRWFSISRNLPAWSVAVKQIRELNRVQKEQRK